MSRGFLVKFALAILAACVVFYFFPLFHIRRLSDRSSESATSGTENVATSPVFDVESYVQSFWGGPLRRGESVLSASELLQAFEKDSDAAMKLGRQVGLGGASYFCIQGSGVVVSVEKNRCMINLDGASSQVCIELGVLVDNTVREAVGVDVNDFANSQEFNSVSTALNLKIESDVIEPNRSVLQPNTKVRFVGCSKIGGKSDLDPLCLVPISLVPISNAVDEDGSRE